MPSYPNIEALANGCISGRLSEWTALRPEARELLAEVERLRGVEKAARALKAKGDAIVAYNIGCGPYPGDGGWVREYEALKAALFFAGEGGRR